MQVIDRVIGLVEGLEKPPPPPDLWQRVCREISQPAGAGSFRLAPAGLELPWPGWQLSSAGNWKVPGAVAATAAVAAAVGLGLFWPHGPDPNLAAPGPMHPTTYLGQADAAKFFDPLADRASIGAVVEVADRTVGFRSNGYRSGIQIDNAISGGVAQ
jgi:hypothetical protein